LNIKGSILVTPSKLRNQSISNSFLQGNLKPISFKISSCKIIGNLSVAALRSKPYNVGLILEFLLSNLSNG
jgi:hypothetical protein